MHPEAVTSRRLVVFNQFTGGRLPRVGWLAPKAGRQERIENGTKIISRLRIVTYGVARGFGMRRADRFHPVCCRAKFKLP